MYLVTPTRPPFLCIFVVYHPFSLMFLDPIFTSKLLPFCLLFLWNRLLSGNAADTSRESDLYMNFIMQASYHRTYIGVFCGKFKQVVNEKLRIIACYFQQILLFVCIKFLECQKSHFPEAYLHIDLVVVCSFQVTHIII